ncbi:hypothetical protein M6D93_13700 [Jatrophihabitans telluris]|uniref:Uncharacterized protein n=1 Tax=Jatrophihabitans telluris TaxID=2038343 RepID=A0ABY4QUL6_9ACTN|nr:hypothetical protein [Jatrophihabitans telluris]UQX87348.1 hypothetical protein M6D93_13700 [Jatrophihabitans telluris]
MLTAPTRLVLFVSSYAPLLALFALLDSFGSGWPSVACAAVAVLGVLALLVVWFLAARSTGEWVRLASARSRDTEVMAFFVSYVVPFAAAGAGDRRQRLALLAFAVIIAALYVRSAVFYVNPLLLLAGYHVFDAVTDTEVPITVICRRRHLRQTEVLWAVSLEPGVYRERNRP